MLKFTSRFLKYIVLEALFIALLLTKNQKFHFLYFAEEKGFFGGRGVVILHIMYVNFMRKITFSTKSIVISQQDSGGEALPT